MTTNKLRLLSAFFAVSLVVGCASTDTVDDTAAADEAAAAAAADAAAAERAAAEAEAARAVAEATVARAGFLPGLTASGDPVNGGGSLNVGAANGLGLGLGANLDAIEQQKAAAQARVGQVQEDANRALRALEGELVSLQRQEAQAQSLAAQAAANYEIFAEQQRAGQRTVPEAVGIFETKVRTEREAAGLRFDVARVELKIAALKGVLVDGDQI